MVECHTAADCGLDELHLCGVDKRNQRSRLLLAVWANHATLVTVIVIATMAVSVTVVVIRCKLWLSRLMICSSLDKRFGQKRLQNHSVHRCVVGIPRW